jgi:hypothetical protein
MARSVGGQSVGVIDSGNRRGVIHFHERMWFDNTVKRRIV